MLLGLVDIHIQKVAGEHIPFSRNSWSFSRQSSASPNSSHIRNFFQLFGWQFIDVLSSGSPGSILLSTPSKTANNNAENARYGLPQDPVDDTPGVCFWILAVGRDANSSRTILELYARFTGASYPGTNRL